ncbi:SCO6745 family protein [Plantactinospora soyae]|uniref:SalK n=1 Tax=Plantactinospora soyae TaxID=1544732 RepID=A0A927MBM2_9ACTN|nr:hypothetical protein [Plantactinospora soyae]MBE1490722.1 hypothetical protein [Plantactinospora soyae]
MWTLYEPVHAVTYFAAEARQAYEAAGLRGYWRGYFAGRAAPLGPVGAAPVVAVFFNFAPAMVVRALPDVWERATPAETLAARLAGATDALARLTAGIPAGTVEAAADLLTEAVGRLDPAGRALGAANAALPVPGDPLARLWQAATALREHRGDGHVAALLAAGLGGCEPLVWRAATDLGREVLQSNRGWSDGEWDAAARRLFERGWLDEDGTPTATGVAAYERIEDVTDDLAAAAWTGVDPERAVVLLAPITDACRSVLPPSNPIGLPLPRRHGTGGGPDPAGAQRTPRGSGTNGH